jgi:tetratricopeptide (TPR) repeat protein
MTLRQRNLFRNSLLQKPLREIESAEIKSKCYSTKDRWGRTVNYTMYHIALQLNSGEYFRLNQYDTRILKGKQKIVEYISKMLQQQQSSDSKQLTQINALEKEIATWQKTLRVSPDNAEAHYNLGLALYRHHQRKEAIAPLQRAKELFKIQGHSQKAAEVQNLLWQLGLE